MNFEPVKIGDWCTLYRGDCIEVLPTLPAGSVDAVVTDPPYGETQLDYDAVPNLTWTQHLDCLAADAVIASCASMRYALQLIPAMPSAIPFRYELVWVKNSATRFLDVATRPLCNHEYVLIFGGTRYRRIDWPRDVMLRMGGREMKPQTTMSGEHWNQLPRTAYVYGRSEAPKTAFCLTRGHNNGLRRKLGYHPSRKPLALMVWLLNVYTNPGHLVLDPFMGSGTTALACRLTGRRFIGCERNGTYFSGARGLIEAQAAQGRMF